MTLIKNDRYLRALRREAVDKTPVWLMRQAGRYLPEYRKVRKEAGDFLTLCKTPELACEVTLQPLARFNLDAAIIFSDILTIPDAMGLGLYFVEGEGPCFEKPIRDKADIDRLPIPDPQQDLKYVMDAISVTKAALNQNIPLIGFSGSPWTLACYSVEGGASKLFRKVKTLMYESPDLMHVLLEKLSDSISLYLKAQIAAGADALMLFDTWGGILTQQAYRTFSLAYMKKIIDKVKQYAPDIPITVFTKQGGQWLEHIAQTGCDAIGLDWTVDIKNARERVGNQVALQGNLDPMIMLTSPMVIKEQVQMILNGYGRSNGHIFNLGHGIDQHTPIEHVQVLVDSVHELSKAYHL